MSSTQSSKSTENKSKNEGETESTKVTIEPDEPEPGTSKESDEKQPCLKEEKSSKIPTKIKTTPAKINETKSGLDKIADEVIIQTDEAAKEIIENDVVQPLDPKKNEEISGEPAKIENELDINVTSITSPAATSRINSSVTSTTTTLVSPKPTTAPVAATSVSSKAKAWAHTMLPSGFFSSPLKNRNLFAVHSSTTFGKTVTYNPKTMKSSVSYPMTDVPPSLQATVLPQKLLYKSTVVEDDEESTGFVSAADSPLLFRAGPYIVRPITPNLNRVNTYTSLNHYTITPRNDSRRFRPGAVRKIRRRAVFKNGDCNILHSRISKRRLRFLQDIFTTLVDAQWRWTLLVFALSFLLSWLGFAVIWWLISFTHGDFEEDHLPGEDQDWVPCVSEIYSFTSCFLFSIETQHTIGYGSRATKEECPEAIFIMCLQSITGVMIQAFMVGIVFAKMTRPKHRTQTLLFSRNAVICQRDSSLCLMFRVGDMRKSHIIGASIRAQLIRPKSTKEGEILNQFQTELGVNADGCDGNLFFIWPMTIVHKIDEDSPLFTLSAADMLQERLEIVVILEGTIESTGQTTQARSSYVPSEVLWGHRFEPVVSYNKERQGYEVNYSKFDSTIPVDTPLCSGAELAEYYRVQEPVGNLPLILMDHQAQANNLIYSARGGRAHLRSITSGSSGYSEPSSSAGLSPIPLSKMILQGSGDSSDEDTSKRSPKHNESYA